MKTQISNLINGSENTVRNLSAKKYADNAIGVDNKPVNGGSKEEVRTRVSELVGAENPDGMNIKANGVELSLSRLNSKSLKSWRWETEISAEQYKQIVGKKAPEWTHKNAVNEYTLTINQDCTVFVYAESGKKGCSEILDEDFIEIL